MHQNEKSLPLKPKDNLLNTCRLNTCKITKKKSLLGVISGVTEWGIYVEITSNKCEGMVRIRDIKNDYYIFDEKQYAIIGQTTKHIYQLGDQVTVKVKTYRFRKKTLRFFSYRTIEFF